MQSILDQNVDSLYVHLQIFPAWPGHYPGCNKCLSRAAFLPEYLVHALLDRVPDDESVDDGLPLLPDAVDAADGLEGLISFFN